VVSSDCRVNGRRAKSVNNNLYHHSHSQRCSMYANHFNFIYFLEKYITPTEQYNLIDCTCPTVLLVLTTTIARPHHFTSFRSQLVIEH
jgi:hypothetical protein